VFSGGNVDIGDLFMTREELEKNPQLLRKRIEQAKQLGGPSRNGGEDGFIVWCTDIKRVSSANKKPATGQKKISQSLPGQESEGSLQKYNQGISAAKTYRILTGAIGVAWWFVSPVFNPRSSLRWSGGDNNHRSRWHTRRRSLSTVVMVLVARLIGVGLQIAKGCIKVCKVLAQL
jgi:hypothetical protein